MSHGSNTYIQLQVSLAIPLGLYPFTLFRLTIFSWRAVARAIYMCPAKPDINIDFWLATARQEKIVKLKGVNGYNPNHIARAAFDLI